MLESHLCTDRHIAWAIVRDLHLPQVIERNEGN
jgi:hypothetical protein